MIREDYKSAIEAWCRFDDGMFTDNISILVYRSSSYYSDGRAVWHIQPRNGTKMCDVNSEFGGFGVAMRLALKMFEGEFKND